MLITENLVIRVMEQRDIEAARILHNDPSVIKFLTDVNFVSEGQQQRWFEAISTSKSSKRFVVEEADGGFVGVFRLDQVDLQNRNALVGLDITPNKRGNGYAKKTFLAMHDYLFDALGLHRLGLYTLASNSIAINLYKALGYTQEGCLKDAIFREGDFCDLLVFGLLRAR